MIRWILMCILGICMYTLTWLFVQLALGLRNRVSSGPTCFNNSNISRVLEPHVFLYLENCWLISGNQTHLKEPRKGFSVNSLSWWVAQRRQGRRSHQPRTCPWRLQVRLCRQVGFWSQLWPPCLCPLPLVIILQARNWMSHPSSHYIIKPKIGKLEILLVVFCIEKKWSHICWVVS